MTKDLENIIKLVDKKVMAQLPSEEGYPSKLVEAMNYAMQAGGKRIRPTLLYLSYKMMLEGGNEPNADTVDAKDAVEACDAFMAAIEMIHTHSLIHDDLPALDNDSLRRGKPTVHVAFNESTAILAGDALLNYAYETINQYIYSVGEEKSEDRDNSDLLLSLIKASNELSQATGIHGMLGGQALDVELSGEPTTTEDRDYIYDHKTCALIKAPLKIGAYLAGCEGDIIDALGRVGYLVGMAFQVQDDILDVTSSAEKLGKEVNQDARNEKNTFVAEYGLERAKEYVRECSEEAIDIVRSKVPESKFRALMIELIEFLIVRDN